MSTISEEMGILGGEEKVQFWACAATLSVGFQRVILCGINFINAVVTGNIIFYFCTIDYENWVPQKSFKFFTED